MLAEIINTEFLEEFENSISVNLEDVLHQISLEKIPADYFQFYNSISSVYSSKIEGEEIDYDSFFKYKFMQVKFQKNYTQKADDLFKAHEFGLKNMLNFKNMLKAHKILSKNLLPKEYQDVFRNNPMFVLNHDERIEYVAADQYILKAEIQKLFSDIEILLVEDLSIKQTFFFAAYIHLVFVKIHPFQDGNGRTARLLEKWFLVQKLGNKAISISLEKNYYQNLQDYYKNIKKLGLEYCELDYSQAIDFLKMTVNGMIKQVRKINAEI